MFNPFKLTRACIAIFQRGLKYDRFITEADIMDLDAGKLILVLRAAKRYRVTVEGFHGDEERTRDFEALCEALDWPKVREEG